MKHDVRVKYSTNGPRDYRDITFENERDAFEFFEDIISGQKFVEAPGGLWINSTHVLEISEPEPLYND